MTLRKKIAGLSLTGIVLTVGAIVGVLLVMQGKVQTRVLEQVNALGASECAKIAKDVYLMLRTQDDLLRVKLEGDLKVARQFIAAEGPLSFAAPARWRAVNQFNQQEREIEMPRMALGSRELPGQHEAGSGTDPLVDKVRELTGSTCTIFQRANDAGDMVRVSTTMLQSDGRRAVGRYIPAVEPDGKTNAVVSAMLAGRGYTGRAFAGDGWYITSYAPLTDGSGKVVGAVCVGVEQEKIPAMRKGIMEIVAGKTGYVFVLGGKDDQKGRYIISAGGKRDGENILDAKDAKGQPFIQELVGKALATRDGASDFVRYDWQNPGENQARRKVTATTYFEPWDWVIGVGAYESDFQEAAGQVQASLQSLLVWLLWVAAGALVLCGLASVMVAGRIAKPVISLTNLLKELSQGQWDLTRRIDVKSSDEVGQLAQWFNHFMQEIHGLIRKIAQTTQSVASASTEIAASSEEISHGMDEQSGQLEQVSAAIHELTGSVVEVSGKCGQTAEQAKASGDLAGKGQQAVEQTVQQMYQISQMIADSSQSVQDLGKRSQQIGQIVQVIKDIADQTNLLALNAAIESARAGEHGRGFAVVADEVRKLAERTTKATDEIAESIRAIQEETGQAVKRIEAGIAQTEGGVRQAGEAGEGMKKIVGSAGEVAGLIASIAAASQQQTTASEQISQNVESMTQVTQQSRQGTAQAAEAAASLSRDAEALQGLVKRFKIDMAAA